MTLKEYYTENEKLQQVFFVMTMIQTWLINTEKLLKEFLFNLALMNRMATKGYMAPRSSADNLIYGLKQVCCEFLVHNWPDRCSYYDSYEPHESVLYCYCNRRQYSFHVDIIDHESVRRAPYGEWDGIENGWSLTDQEYQAAREHKRGVDEIVPRTKAHGFQEKLLFLKAAREYLANRTIEMNAEEKFWRELLSILPPQKLKNKCVVERNLDKCLDRYLELLREKFTDKEIRLMQHHVFHGDAFEELYKFKGIYGFEGRWSLEKVVRRIADDMANGCFHNSNFIEDYGRLKYESPSAAS